MALASTQSAIMSALEFSRKMDPSVTDATIKAVFQALNGTQDNPGPKDYILSRKEVAKRFGFSLKAVDYHCRKGNFKRIRIGNSTRARGISGLSVEAVLNGGL